VFVAAAADGVPAGWPKDKSAVAKTTNVKKSILINLPVILNPKLLSVFGC